MEAVFVPTYTVPKPIRTVEYEGDQNRFLIEHIFRLPTRDAPGKPKKPKRKPHDTPRNHPEASADPRGPQIDDPKEPCFFDFEII
jgi:hypothetical protein